MIVGFAITGMAAEKARNISGKIRVDNNIRIVNVDEVKPPSSKEKIARIFFDFHTSYSEGKNKTGLIKMKGYLIYKGAKTAILKKWKKEKKLPDKLVGEIMNHILHRCIVRAVGLAEQLALPPPISLPVMKVKEKSKATKDLEYIG